MVKNESWVRGFHSSARDDWETPPEVFGPLHKEFGFTLDPCCSERTAKCPTFFTEKDNGLIQSWAPHVVFMNPPYGKTISQWVRKAYEESLLGATVVGLLPSRTDTHWWHDWVQDKAEVRFRRGRIKFMLDGVQTIPGTFGSAVAVWRPPVK